jgi:hypothetical protein
MRADQGSVGGTRREAGLSSRGKPRVLDLHPPHVAGWTDISRGRWTRHGCGRIDGRADGSRAQRRLPKDTSTERELDLTPPIGKEPVVSQPLEAPRQDMQEKPPQEFDGVQRHGTLPIPAPGVFPPECHLAIATGQQASRLVIRSAPITRANGGNMRWPITRVAWDLPRSSSLMRTWDAVAPACKSAQALASCWRPCARARSERWAPSKPRAWPATTGTGII